MRETKQIIALFLAQFTHSTTASHNSLDDASAKMLEGMGLSGRIPFAVYPWFYVYLVADVTILPSLAAALGAGCSSPQHAQQLAIVLLAAVMIPYFLLAFVMRQPNGAISTALSFFPPFAPMLMLLRQAIPAAAYRPGSRGSGSPACWPLLRSWWWPRPASSGLPFWCKAGLPRRRKCFWAVRDWDAETLPILTTSSVTMF